MGMSGYLYLLVPGHLLAWGHKGTVCKFVLNYHNIQRMSTVPSFPTCPVFSVNFSLDLA